MIARRRPPQAYRLRENAPGRMLLRALERAVRWLWNAKQGIAIAVLVLVSMELTYREEVAAERAARARAEAERNGVVELIWSMIHKPTGYSVALSARTPAQLAERLSTARHVVLEQRP